MKVEKKLIDNLIKTCRDYYNGSDDDNLDLYNLREKELESYIRNNYPRKNYMSVEWLADIIKDLAMYSHYNNDSYEWIYNVLNAMGIEVIESESE